MGVVRLGLRSSIIKVRTGKPSAWEHRRYLSEGKQHGEVDSLAMAKTLQVDGGFPSKQAESLASVIHMVMVGNMEKATQDFYSKSDEEKARVAHETLLLKFKSELKANQERFIGALRRQNEMASAQAEMKNNKLQSLMKTYKAEVAAELDLKIDAVNNRIDEGADRLKLQWESEKSTVERGMLKMKAQMERARVLVISLCAGAVTLVAAIEYVPKNLFN